VEEGRWEMGGKGKGGRKGERGGKKGKGGKRTGQPPKKYFDPEPPLKLSLIFQVYTASRQGR